MATTTLYLVRRVIVIVIAAGLLAAAILTVTTIISRNACTEDGGTLYGTTCFLPIPVEDWMQYRPGDSL